MLVSRFLRLSVIYALIGMSIGIHMAMSHDHAQAPTHAHLNLLGFVAMFLYGLFYRGWPEAAAGRLAHWHFWIANIGLIGGITGIALIYGGLPEAEPLAAVSSLLMIAGMAIFAVIVFRATRTSPA